MKIIIWSAHFLPNLGGVERYTYHIAKEFIKNGNEVTIITSNIQGLETYEEIEGMKIIRVDVISLLNGRFPIIKSNKKNRGIIKSLKKEKFDYSIINTRFYFHSLIGAIFSKKNVKKTVLIDHGTGHFTVNNQILDFFGHIYEHLISYFVKKNVTSFYGVSLACNEWLKHFKITAKGVFYNSVDKNIEKDEYFNVKETFNLNDESILIAFTGRLIKEKGVLKIIQSFDIISRKYKNIVLFIIGDGELYDDIIKNNKNSRIFITGRMEHKKIMKLLEQSDIFILPTDFPEGLPTSVLEAGLEKCAIIATNKGGSPEVILDSEYGIILKKNNNEEIIENLEKLINSKDMRKKMAENVYKRVIENFNWENTANQILNEFNAI
ncbi:glycosyltransferase family 4 protein [Sebaldella sp. S0638]|uniref:glycosyltransferase family 4 protein n=1 Tax=Sebaldella sp. S0638 TaxID=2957809 RepID=UPI0020A0F7F3|nr:glycosyltransferase family 4 protein [Sebaldella sp. S0638]MCP1225884.1 glycosyltransferase family 4 protein [Sebaldella sp. S0638]